MNSAFRQPKSSLPDLQWSVTTFPSSGSLRPLAEVRELVTVIRARTRATSVGERRSLRRYGPFEARTSPSENHHPANGYSENPSRSALANPELCQSELARKSSSFAFWLFRLILARSTAEVGSRTRRAGVETNGQYLNDCEVGRTSELCTGIGGKALQEPVWTELVRKLEAIQPVVPSNF
ncbi:Uu.00g140730.m01.CDS01 [Anthostomella pinea]|uniref:Uu.00g140730.m01.CDS01 n=1 Tax=Anthostomella pinea TaxID=933095 RepID=A0AAI8YLD6_9PEZI|nr:Uu.00g140730.m01.CDS01 [Anthostomella pinea]